MGAPVPGTAGAARRARSQQPVSEERRPLEGGSEPRCRSCRGGRQLRRVTNAPGAPHSAAPRPAPPAAAPALRFDLGTETKYRGSEIRVWRDRLPNVWLVDSSIGQRRSRHFPTCGTGMLRRGRTQRTSSGLRSSQMPGALEVQSVPLFTSAGLALHLPPFRQLHF